MSSGCRLVLSVNLSVKSICDPRLASGIEEEVERPESPVELIESELGYHIGEPRPIAEVLGIESRPM